MFVTVLYFKCIHLWLTAYVPAYYCTYTVLLPWLPAFHGSVQHWFNPLLNSCLRICYFHFFSPLNSDQLMIYLSYYYYCFLSHSDSYFCLFFLIWTCLTKMFMFVEVLYVQVLHHFIKEVIHQPSHIIHINFLPASAHLIFSVRQNIFYTKISFLAYWSDNNLASYPCTLALSSLCKLFRDLLADLLIKGSLVGHCYE